MSEAMIAELQAQVKRLQAKTIELSMYNRTIDEAFWECRDKLDRIRLEAEAEQARIEQHGGELGFVLRVLKLAERRT